MTWLVTASSEKLAAPYLDWLRTVGVQGVAVWSGNPVPGPAGLDALLLAGGGDVAPRRYGAVAEPETANVNEQRDEMEIELIRLFMAAGKPVFGICRGIQILNVAVGGGLIQHIPHRLSNTVPVEHHRATDRRDAIHGVEIDRGTLLGLALHNVGTVNSAHHQAVDPSRLAQGIRVVCSSPVGIVEAIESTSPDGNLSAVQWHPERLPTDHPASRDLLQFWVEITAQEAE